MTFTVGTFESPNGKVRTAAVDVTLEVYKQSGNIIRTYLKNQKPALLRELKSKVVSEAKNTRTKSAPIQRLATIVQPFGFEDSEENRPQSWQQDSPTASKFSQSGPLANAAQRFSTGSLAMSGPIGLPRKPGSSLPGSRGLSSISTDLLASNSNPSSRQTIRGRLIFN
eukprot:GEZU01036605.1.p1 GENE.GEZU01036605.1~~GEZU01036605.1.p1  ORF type:complete len:168 (-),score=15.44 GEZU01036605.1:231-734(-)